MVNCVTVTVAAIANSNLTQIQNFVQNEGRQLHELPVFAEAKLANLPIERLVRLQGLRASLAPLTGRINGQFDSRCRKHPRRIVL